jgi:hypothetical protein
VVQGIVGEIQKLEMLQSQLKQGPIWAQRCPAWKADVQRIDACVIDREGGSEQSHRPQCQTVTATFQWPRERLRSDMCMFDGAQSAPCNQPGLGMACKGVQVPLPPEFERYPPCRSWVRPHKRPVRADPSFGR